MASSSTDSIVEIESVASGSKCKAAKTKPHRALVSLSWTSVQFNCFHFDVCS